MTLILIVIASIYDLKYMKIPNYISLLILLVGLYNGKIYISGLLVAIIILAITLIPKYENYKGGGDIKLLGAIGLVKGFIYVYLLFLLSDLIEIIYRYIVLKSLKKEYKTVLPYAPFILISYLILTLLI